MAVNLRKRVGRIISGSLHAIVDAVEGAAPELVMEQAIREIDGAIGEVRQELGKLLSSKHLATQQLAQKNEEHEGLKGKIEAALEENREDLAEVGVGRQLDIEAQIPILEHTITENAEKERELEGFIVALQGKKREMEEELKQFRLAASAVIEGKPEHSSVGQKVDEATSAFDRILVSHGRLAGKSIKESTQLAELETLSRKNRIQERLQLMRAEEDVS